MLRLHKGVKSEVSYFDYCLLLEFDLLASLAVRYLSTIENLIKI